MTKIREPLSIEYVLSNVISKLDENDIEDDFCMFMKAVDDRHAVMLTREHLDNQAPKGQSIIKGIEKKGNCD